jgi:hypothetical protein
MEQHGHSHACPTGCAIGEVLGLLISLPVNRFLIVRGRGHSIVHSSH